MKARKKASLARPADGYLDLALGFGLEPLIASLGGGALPYKPIPDVPFFRVSFFSINS